MMAYLEMLTVVLAHPPVTDAGFLAYRDSSLRNVINSVNSDGLTLDEAYLLEVRNLETNLISVNQQNSLMGGTGGSTSQKKTGNSTDQAASNGCTKCTEKDRQIQALKDKLTAQENLTKNKQQLLERYKAKHGDLFPVTASPGPSGSKKVQFAAGSRQKRKRP